MAKRYLVRLSEAEQREVEAGVKTGRVAARKRVQAQILLKAAEGEHGPAWTAAALMKALAVSMRTVERRRQCLVEAGVETALTGRPQARYQSPKREGGAGSPFACRGLSHPADGA